VTDASDYTIPVHGERRGLHHVAIEVRQDLIAGDKGQRAWGPLLARLLARAHQELVAAEALRRACRRNGVLSLKVGPGRGFEWTPGHDSVGHSRHVCKDAPGRLEGGGPYAAVNSRACLTTMFTS
jgi:hypothetical protein